LDPATASLATASLTDMASLSCRAEKGISIVSDTS
jgi:hypothetical protein